MKVGLTDADSIFTGLNITITAIAVVVAGIAIWVQQYYQQRLLDRDGMLKIFDLLSNEESKLHRRRAYQAFCSGKFDTNGKLLDNSFLKDIEYIRTAFGQIGSLVKDKYVPKNAFLRTYSGVIIKSWKAVEKNVRRERELRKTQDYMETFEWLYCEATKH